MKRFHIGLNNVELGNENPNLLVYDPQTVCLFERAQEKYNDYFKAGTEARLFLVEVENGGVIRFAESIARKFRGEIGDATGGAAAFFSVPRDNIETLVKHIQDNARHYTI